MLTVRSFTVLCIITVLVSVAAVLVSESSGTIPGSGTQLFPGLMPRINAVERIEAESGSGRFVLERGKDGWVVPEKSGYPANADKVHTLLVGAAGLKRIEPKTIRPELYEKLGLSMVSDDATSAIAYRLVGPGDETLAALIVGKSIPAKGDPELSEFYVRVPDDPQSWLAEGTLPQGTALMDWLDRAVIKIDRARVREVRVDHSSGDVVSVTKEAPSNADFRLEDMPPAKTVDGQWKLNDIGRLLSDFEFEDVRTRDAAPLEGEPDYTVTMLTFDGLEVRMHVYKADQRAFGFLRAAFQPPEAETASTEGSLLTADQVRAEAQKLNAKWREWVYEIPGFKFDALARTRAQLIKDDAQAKQPEQG